MKISREQQEASLTLNSFLTTILQEDTEGMKALLDQISAEEAFQTLISSVWLLKAILDIADLELQERANVQINFSEMIKANAEMILSAELLDEG